MQEGEVETVAEHAAPNKCIDSDETPPLAAVTTLTTDEAANGGKIELELGLLEEQTKSNENSTIINEATVAENGNKKDFEKLLIPTVEFVKPKDPAPIKQAKIETYDEDIDDETKESFEGFNGTGRTLTLQMLMGANVIQPGKGVLTIEYLGQKFVGDLLADGKIKSQETETIFLTPSAWAMHCKRIINPEKKSGCGWASVKYKGKKLDAYKNTWLRKCATAQKEAEAEEHEVLCADGEKKSDITETVVKRAVFPHNTISDRKVVHDGNMLIESVPFNSIGKLQPFLIKMNSSALFLADFHAHLTMHEVFGYLGGSWDNNTQTLIITKAYPCRNSRHDRGKAVEVESEIQKAMKNDETILVGWYHTHAKFQAEPTLRDIDTQLEYQISMRGNTEEDYTPCVSLIISPYYEENPSLESVVKSIWVTPPAENKLTEEYGRPMTMQYALLPEKELPVRVRTEMEACVDYYKEFEDEIIKFSGIYQNDVTFIDKLKHSLYTKFPLNNDDKLLWNFICEILCCEQEEYFRPPKTVKIVENNEEIVTTLFKKTEIALMTNLYETKINEMIALKEKEAQNELKVKLEAQQNKQAVTITKQDQQQQQQNANCEQKQSELKVLSLQEQLCLPSGLNMNPVRMLSPLATPNPIAAVPPLLPAPTAVVTVPLPPPPPPPPPLLSTTTTLPYTTTTTIQTIPTTTSSGNNMSILTTSNNMLQLTSTTPTYSTATAATAVTPTINLLGPPTSTSPISIPSNAPSPAKFELPVRASPSPAKSDTSSHTSRTRASPSASPGKYSGSGELTRNSPCRTPNNTHLPLPPPMPPGFGVVPSANDLMQASLAHFAGQLPPNFLQADLAALFAQQQQLHQQQLQQQQQQTSTRKDYGNSSLNQLAAAAAKAGATKSTTNHLVTSNSNNNTNTNNNNNLANVMSSSSRHGTDANVAAAVAAYSSNFNIPRVHEKTKSERSSKSSSTSSNSSSSANSCASTNSYRTKLMKELDDLKNDPLKMSELMRSPEYAALLLQQAEALGANSLAGNFGGDFNYLANTSALNMSASAANSMTNNQSKSAKASATTTSAAAAAAAAANMALTADYNNLIQASKLLGYDAYLQQAKNSDSINAFLQQQMAAAINVPSASSAKKLLQQQQQQAVQQQLQQLHLQQQHQQQVAAQQAAAQQQQQQAAAVAAAAAAAAAAHPDYAALLQTYSKLFDTNNAYNSGHKNFPNNAMHHELTALLSAGSLAGMAGIPGMAYANNVMNKNTTTNNNNNNTGSGSSSKHNKQYKSATAKSTQQQQQQQQQQAQQHMQHNTDMLNQLLQAENQQQQQQHHHQQQQQQQQNANLNAALLYQQHKSAAELNALFAMPTGSMNKSLGNAAIPTTTTTTSQAALNDPAAYYNALAHEKMQDYAAFLQQQHSKYGIPDPLAKSTLAANNMFMSPSALLKMQQESLNAMMMKPPKTTTPVTMHRQRETSLSPALERLTPTKNNSGVNNSSGKYNFSAVDLAISSVSSNTPSPAASDSSNSSTHRRPAYTPPVDLSRFYGELMPPHLSAAAAAAGMTRKRMEFSSIADLAAPPPAKLRKPNEDVLNLSNEQ